MKQSTFSLITEPPKTSFANIPPMTTRQIRRVRREEAKRNMKTKEERRREEKEMLKVLREEEKREDAEKQALRATEQRRKRAERRTKAKKDKKKRDMEDRRRRGLPPVPPKEGQSTLSNWGAARRSPQAISDSGQCIIVAPLPSLILRARYTSSS
jgi:hypothetical protein